MAQPREKRVFLHSPLFCQCGWMMKVHDGTFPRELSCSNSECSEYWKRYRAVTLYLQPVVEGEAETSDAGEQPDALHERRERLVKLQHEIPDLCECVTPVMRSWTDEITPCYVIPHGSDDRYMASRTCALCHGTGRRSKPGEPPNPAVVWEGDNLRIVRKTSDGNLHLRHYTFEIKQADAMGNLRWARYFTVLRETHDGEPKQVAHAFAMVLESLYRERYGDPAKERA